MRVLWIVWHGVTRETLRIVEKLTAKIKIPFKTLVTIEKKKYTTKGGLVIRRILRLDIHSVVGRWRILKWVMRGMIVLREHLTVAGVVCLERILVCRGIRIPRIDGMHIDLCRILIIIDMIIVESRIISGNIGDLWRRRVKGEGLARSDVARRMFHWSGVKCRGGSAIVLRRHRGALVRRLHWKCIEREHRLLGGKVDLAAWRPCIDRRIGIRRPKHLEARLHLVRVLLGMVEWRWIRWYVHGVVDCRRVIRLLKCRILHLRIHLRVWTMVYVTLSIPFRRSDFELEDVGCTITKGLVLFQYSFDRGRDRHTLFQLSGAFKVRPSFRGFILPTSRNQAT